MAATALTRYSQTFLQMVRRDVRNRFAGSALGATWTILNPLVQLAAYTFVFVVVYRVQMYGSRSGAVAFLFAGLWPWFAFQEGALRATSAVVDHAHIIRNTPTPAALPVLAASTGAFVVQMLGLLLFVAALLVLAPSGHPSLLLLLPAAMGIQLAVTWGLALGLSALYVLFRDVLQVAQVGLMLWFFLTPILYPLEAVPERLQTVMTANPMLHLMSLYRHAILAEAAPTLAGMAYLGVVTLAVAATGAWLFGRLRPVFDDYL